MKIGLTTSMFIGAICAFAASATEPLAMPRIPSELTSPADRGAYLSVHYWDALDFVDDARAADTAFMEQALVDFLSIMPHVPEQARRDGLAVMFGRASADEDASELLRLLCQIYLSDAGSPMRDERLYVDMLEADAMSQPEGSATGIRRMALAEEMKKNLPGDVAADFAMVTADGGDAPATLHRLVTRPTLMLVYNPDCGTCHEVIDAMKRDAALQHAVAVGTVSVLAVAVDTGRDMWESYRGNIPTEWVSALDTDGIGDNEIYYVPETPMVYLIGGDCRVIDRGLYMLRADGSFDSSLIARLLQAAGDEYSH